VRRLIILTVVSLLLGAVAGVETWAQGAQGNAPRPRPATPASKAAAPPSDPAKDDKNAPVVVDADSLDSFQKQGLAIFKGNVIARQNNSVQYADKMEVYTDSKTDRVERVVSTGNIRIITRDCRMGTAERAEYYDAEQRVVLIGNARVWRDSDVVTGERITIYIAEDRSVVEGGKQERVKAIFYQQGQGRPKSEIKFGPAGPICP
jgi:lipopolysaccharide export system protein LptA